MTDLRDIGLFFARIIADERTLNGYVFCWAEEKTQVEIWDMAERISGQKVRKAEVTEATLLKQISSALDADRKAGKPSIETTHGQYMNSLWIRGDNTVENAKKPEYGSALDARELYPDLHTRSFEEYVKEMYS